MPRTTYYCTATVTEWNAGTQDYDEIDLDHYSSEPTAEAAEADAREAWSEHGLSPEKVRVRAWEVEPPPGERWHVEPTNDGDGDGSGAIIVDEDGEVVATIHREGWVPLPAFHRAMKSLDPAFDPQAYGHG